MKGQDRILLLCTGVELLWVCSAGLYGWTSAVRHRKNHSSLPRLASAVSEKHVIKQVTICNSNMFVEKKTSL